MIEIWNPSLREILPESVLADERLRASADALDLELKKLSKLTVQVLHLPRLDELPEKVLDLLAWGWHVDFYEPEGMDIQTKRELIRRTIKWHRIKGTKAAVLELARTVMSDATIEEWFDYDGQPFRFKLKATGLRFDDDNGATFFRMIESVKNVRSWLENVLIDLTQGEDELNVGQVIHLNHKIENVLKMEKVPAEAVDYEMVVQDVSRQSARDLLKLSVETEKSVVQVEQCVTKLLVKADEVKEWTPDFERYLWERWKRFKSDPLIRTYESNHNYDNEYDFSDSEIREEYPLGQFLRLYFKIGESSRVRTLTVKRLREDIESSKIKEFGEYTVGHRILTSRSGAMVSELKSAFYVTKTIEAIL